MQFNQPCARETLTLNDDWRFHLGDLDNINFDAIHQERFAASQWLKAGNHGPSKPNYPDSDWRTLQLPHDWVVEGEFSPDANQVHGSLPVGVAWYRRTFELSEADVEKRIRIEFDGVFRNCSVWLNGHFVGRHLSGYTGFGFDMTEICNFGGANSLAVYVDATEFELWSYEGAGIYRDVRLVKTHPLHIAPDGVFVQATPSSEKSPASAQVEIECIIDNDGEAREAEIAWHVTAPDGAVVASAETSHAMKSWQSETFSQKLRLEQPQLWSTASPALYTLQTRVKVDGATVDEIATKFGVRSLRFDAEQGFFLNGESMKLLGTCCHQDHAGVGIAIPRALHEWRVKRLLEMGSNALRTSHNPPDPVLLDVCDELGLMVMDETRLVGTSSEVLGQLESLIRRDRNHASVILWSIGNEEMNVQNTIVGVRQMKRMQELCHRLDSSRLVTYAMNCQWLDNAALHHENGFHLDVFGANYTCQKWYHNSGAMYDEFHELYPDWPILGSETGGSASTRGLYEAAAGEAAVEYIESAAWQNPARKNVVGAYGETCTPWGVSIEETWKDCAERPFLAGTFLWTGFDYRGETYPCSYPAVVTRYGLMDLCGFPKDAFFYYRAWWQNEPVLHVLPHWNWAGREGEPIDVWCYTNCARVELWLNGRAVDSLIVERNSDARFAVPFEAGTLEARGFDNAGTQIMTTTVKTAGAAAQIELLPDRDSFDADGEDVLVVNVAIRDADGTLMPRADDLIEFEIDGPARLLGVGNGDPVSHESDVQPRRKAYHGRCQILLGATSQSGSVTLRASAMGLPDATLIIEAVEAEGRAFVPARGAVEARADKAFNAVDGAL